MRFFLDPKRDIDAALLRYRRLFGVLALFSGVINLLMLVPSVYMMQVFDRVLTSRNETTLLMLSLILLIFFALSCALEWVRGQVMIKMSAGLDTHLGERVFDAAFQRSLKEHNANPAQVLSDLNSIRQFVTGPGVVALFDAPWLPIYLVATFLFHPWLGVFTVVGSLILVGLGIWNELATRKSMSEANRLSVSSSSYVNSTLQNAEVIQALGMLTPLRRRWFEVQQRVITEQGEASDRSSLIAALSRFVRMTWQSLALGLGAVLVIENQISAGVMIAVSVLLGRAMAPAEALIGSWKQMGSAKSSYERLNRLLKEFPQEPARMPLPAPSGALSIERLVVTPPGQQRPAVNGVTIKLDKGEVLAIIGPSASGKSSLTRAMVGIWPTSHGSVRLDNAEISQWSREALGPHLGYLPQDIELFDGTIAQNIARFGEVDSSKVIEAAQLAGIHEMILHFPKGYDTLLGNGGLGLSGGQKQRVGLARALYGKPALVVLDEPNSNLDEAGEAALLQALRQLKADGSTVVLVTHRPSVLGVVDKLLFIKDGIQQLYGPRDQVMKTLVPQNAQKPGAAASPTTVDPEVSNPQA
ncbi:type I secretion system permease/ATPase [Pseudomonas sp. 21LCFQ02]|uniref:type I secretion system permease/ATPase n=1 Tax=unclassified Pseudomonas TaxID=196821 RepID=UPI0004F60179|nr:MULTISPECIES: type I secretion system permease/ATPase [unclassified Pseudomonas]MCO8169024.1 type I secretion system permease/ATPase [Pseudomonas sp. 21LCFQ02]MCQ9425644.1 type I secretion system permease/ATPase [Pseudomonas sp. LJDD11]BAP45973.1 type I secretion system ATPase [Pseudomonas sp. StFLB209]